MGADWVVGGKIRPIEVERLAGTDINGYQAIKVLSDQGSTFILNATTDTYVADELVHNVRFRTKNTEEIFSDDEVTWLLAPLIAASSLNNWVKERRHFPADEIVSIPVSPLQARQPLEYQGHASSPLNRGFVFMNYPGNIGIPLF